jgi:hypothetical protein
MNIYLLKPSFIIILLLLSLVIDQRLYKPVQRGENYLNIAQNVIMPHAGKGML